jgi:hypothetical protein
MSAPLNQHSQPFTMSPELFISSNSVRFPGAETSWRILRLLLLPLIR